ncbi:hypothetical protein KR018_008687 [Drosophila ironensis]|nr:hypothetical protein KR018_008687 [Drosophila ironensis]
MPVCRFFQSGTCRYGTKCHNEHFDVKQYLKSDMESCIHGKMWPFSVYGPFKDKPNFPNFIEDQSFEEVRFLCYEAKRTNTFEQFHQQFNREALEATNKMKTMLQMPHQILDMMIKIYDAPEATSSGTQQQQQPSNPFAAVPAANQGASIFAKPALSAGNIFGGATAQASTSGSIFGASMGGGNAGNSVFGGGSGTSIFAQAPQQQQQQPAAGAAFQGGNIFGHAQAQVPAANTNAFGGFQQQQPQQQSGIFEKNLFANAAQQQQQQPPPPNGLFSQAAAGFPTQQQQQQQQQMQMQQQQQLQMQQQQQQQMQLQQQQQQQQMQMQQQQQQLQMQQQQPPQQQPPAQNSSVYSALESLTAAEIEAFKADQFLPGNLPVNPPAREFC